MKAPIVGSCVRCGPPVGTGVVARVRVISMRIEKVNCKCIIATDVVLG